MVVLRKKNIFFVVFLLLKTQACFTISIDTTLTGTPNTVCVEAPMTFSDGDYVLGFVNFQNGFTLSSTGTLQFGSVAPVNGPINLNGGTLKLTNDFYFGNSATINGPGFINFNQQVIYLSNFCTLANGPIHIVGDGGFAGNGNLLYFNTPVNFYPSKTSSSNVNFFDIILMYVGSNTFKAHTYTDPMMPFIPNIVRFTLSNAAWLLDYHSPMPFILDAELYIPQDTEIIGVGLQMKCLRAVNVAQAAILTIGTGVLFDLGPNSSIGFQDNTGSLVLDNATLEFENSNPFLTGNFIVQGNSTISSPSFGGPFYFGNGYIYRPQDDPTLIINPGSKLTIADRTTVIYKGQV